MLCLDCNQNTVVMKQVCIIPTIERQEREGERERGRVGREGGKRIHL